MRAKEFITEQSNLPDRITKPMPSTWVIPELQNQNAYLQYRFAVALAGARLHVMVIYLKWIKILFGDKIN